MGYRAPEGYVTIRSIARRLRRSDYDNVKKTLIQAGLETYHDRLHPQFVLFKAEEVDRLFDPATRVVKESR